MAIEMIEVSLQYPSCERRAVKLNTRLLTVIVDTVITASITILYSSKVRENPMNKKKLIFFDQFRLICVKQDLVF